MKSRGYVAAREDPQGAGVKSVPCGIISLVGRDRQAFLQGQVSNDVLRLAPGQGAHACLLDNKGHLLADLAIHVYSDYLLLETDLDRADLVQKTLSRFLVRERVQIDNVTSQWEIVTIQGSGALHVLSEIVDSRSPLTFNGWLSHASARTPVVDMEAFVVRRRRTSGSDGYDLWLPKALGPGAMDCLIALPGVESLDEETFDMLRIEAGIPQWGAELDESVIPLEAGMEDAISFTKGCYMGQEVIARIRARGHTNRTLMGVKLSDPMPQETKLVAKEGDRKGEEVGSLTSSCISPELGPIAMGYVRNEYAHSGASLLAGKATATVVELPFVAAP